MLKVSSITSENRLFLLLLLIFAILMLICSGQGSFPNTDDYFFAIRVVQAKTASDLLNFPFFKVVFPEKPPLYYWILWIFVQIFGTKLWVFRLPSIIAALSVLFFTWRIASVLFKNQYAAMLTAIFLFQTTYFYYMSRRAMADMLLLAFIVGAVYFFLITPNQPRAALWTMIFLGLTFMTKSLMIYVPLVIMGLKLLTTDSKARDRLNKYRLNKYRLYGILLFLAIVLPWHIAQFLHNPHAFVNDYVNFILFNRFSKSFFGHNDSLIYFKLIGSSERFLSLLFIVALIYLIYRSIKHDRVAWFILGVIVMLMLPFQLSATKKYQYILPIFPWLALAVAFVAHKFSSKILILLNILFFILFFPRNFEHLTKPDYAPIDRMAIASSIKQLKQADIVVSYNIYNLMAPFKLNRFVPMLTDIPAFYKAVAQSPWMSRSNMIIKDSPWTYAKSKKATTIAVITNPMSLQRLLPVPKMWHESRRNCVKQNNALDGRCVLIFKRRHE